MAIECVTIENNHLFPNNPVAEQHRLRYRSIIERQNWDLPIIGQMEYDQYDNPSAVYLIWRDDNMIARGLSRLYPTDRPFMLKDSFSYMVNYRDIPTGSKVMEGSRFCIDKDLDLVTRKRIAQEIVLSYLEYGVRYGLNKIIGIMYPVYWRNLFENNGWKPTWIGDVEKTAEGRKTRAAILPISAEILAKVRETTGIYEDVTIFKSTNEAYIENVKAA